MQLGKGVALDLVSVSSEHHQTKSALLVAQHVISDIYGFSRRSFDRS